MAKNKTPGSPSSGNKVQSPQGLIRIGGNTSGYPSLTELLEEHVPLRIGEELVSTFAPLNRGQQAVLVTSQGALVYEAGVLTSIIPNPRAYSGLQFWYSAPLQAPTEGDGTFLSNPIKDWGVNGYDAARVSGGYSSFVQAAPTLNNRPAFFLNGGGNESTPTMSSYVTNSWELVTVFRASATDRACWRASAQTGITKFTHIRDPSDDIEEWTGRSGAATGIVIPAENVPDRSTKAQMWSVKGVQDIPNLLHTWTFYSNTQFVYQHSESLISFLMGFSGAVSIGGDAAGQESSGYLGEFCMFSPALSDEDRTALFAYFQAIYDLDTADVPTFPRSVDADAVDFYSTG